MAQSNQWRNTFLENHWTLKGEVFPVKMIKIPYKQGKNQIISRLWQQNSFSINDTAYFIELNKENMGQRFYVQLDIQRKGYRTIYQCPRTQRILLLWVPFHLREHNSDNKNIRRWLQPQAWWHWWLKKLPYKERQQSFYRPPDRGVCLHVGRQIKTKINSNLIKPVQANINL